MKVEAFEWVVDHVTTDTERSDNPPNDTPNQLRAATARQQRRGAAVAAPNNCIGRSELQLP
jgi:hypothetical protein